MMTRMLLLTLMAFAIAPGFCYGSLFIDYGASQETNVSNILFGVWQTDEGFIKSGENKLLTSNQTLTEFNTLRYFPKGKKNCYKLRFYNSNERIFRAGFYYGNYNGLSKPPSFGLEIDGHSWANVTTSMSDEPSFYEMIYIARKDEVQVCLVRSEDDEIPFISSLEAIYTYPDSYKLVDNDTALYLHHRINFGANKGVEGEIGKYEEDYRRIWKSEETSGYINIHSDDIPMTGLSCENRPPWQVMAHAIQAENLSDSISLSFDFSPRSSVQAYFVLYLLDPIFRKVPPNATSNVEIFVNNNKMAAVGIPNYYNSSDPCLVVSLIKVPITGSMANVTIVPAEGSTLAPILNGVEVFSGIDVSAGIRLGFSTIMFFVALCVYSLFY